MGSTYHHPRGAKRRDTRRVQELDAQLREEVDHKAAGLDARIREETRGLREEMDDRMQQLES